MFIVVTVRATAIPIAALRFKGYLGERALVLSTIA